MKNTIFTITLAVLISISFASAIIVNDVEYSKLYPGKEGSLTINLENNGNNVIDDVSLVLNLPSGFVSVGSSEDSIDEIEDDSTEDFDYVIKVSSTVKPGDYSLPYTVTYTDSGDKKSQTGSIGITVSGSPDLEFSVSTENPIANQKGKLSLKIVNKGLGDARFVSVKLSPAGYSLLSEESVYVGTVSSDDFETTSFDVLFQSQSPIFTAILEYRDIDNNLKTETINIPFIIYSQEKAIQLGIIKKSNALLYFIVIVFVIVIWIIWRSISKARRLRKSRQQSS